MEVKSSSAVARDIEKDLGTLTLFRAELGYQRAIYLIYGADALNAGARVRECAARFREIAPFELWLHPAAGTAAQS
jgi:hypothetical protein